MIPCFIPGADCCVCFLPRLRAQEPGAQGRAERYQESARFSRAVLVASSPSQTIRSVRPDIGQTLYSAA
jgi:hypothetical protein